MRRMLAGLTSEATKWNSKITKEILSSTQRTSNAENSTKKKKKKEGDIKGVFRSVKRQ